MATPEDFQFGSELRVVPDIKTKHGAYFLLGCIASLNESQKNGNGLIGLFEAPLYDFSAKPIPVGYLVFKVNDHTIECCTLSPFYSLIEDPSQPTWVKDSWKLSSSDGIRASPMRTITVSRLNEKGEYVQQGVVKPQTFGDRRNQAIQKNPQLKDFPMYDPEKNPGRRFELKEYTHLGLGELLVTKLEQYAKTIGITTVEFKIVNEFSHKLLKQLGYIGDASCMSKILN